jgi:hypothetical protein
MKRYLGAAFAAAVAALCQTPARAIDLNVVVIATCGTVPLSLPTGTGYSIFTDQNGNLCMNGSVTVTPSGTQNVNLTQIQGAAPSLTNPLWVTPATGASFAVTGTFWQATQPVSIAAAPLRALGITPTDRTITSASGSSQQMMAANASRHSITIENTGSANCGINPTGGTAAIGGAGTITLAPLGSYTPRAPTLSAVTVICTAGQPIYGDEN